MAKKIKNVSDEVYNHGLFMGLAPGFEVAVEDEVATQLMLDHPGKFECSDETYGVDSYVVVDSLKSLKPVVEEKVKKLPFGRKEKAVEDDVHQD